MSEDPNPQTIVESIEQSCAHFPDRVAVTGVGETLTYAELWQRVTNLALELIARGVTRESFVGLWADQSSDLLVGLVAIMAAGGVYVPLDPSYPRERLEFVVGDAKLPLIVAPSRDRDQAEQLGVPILSTTPTPTRFATELPHVKGEDAAYLIYTSGSTGRPKGVVVEHHSLVDMTSWMIADYSVKPGDKYFASSSPSFDASLPSLLLPLMTGGTFVALPRENATDPYVLAKSIEAYRPRFVQIMPTMLRMLTESGWRGDEQLEFWAGGERTATPTVRYIAPRVAALLNFYGPTEATFAVSVAKLRDDDEDSPVGFSPKNVQCVLLDDDGSLTSKGETGELFITGTQLARGYLNDVSLTNERFTLIDPGDGHVVRAYRTGDLARVRSDGSLVIVGRADDQVKIRGYRVEPGEVEQRLMQFSGVVEAYVIAETTNAEAEPRLVAFVKGSDDLDIDELRDYAKETLPNFMVPSRFIVVNAFATGTTGKVDRKELAALLARSEAATVTGSRRDDNAEEATDTETWIRQLFATVLEVDEAGVGLDDDFFDLGGTSLRCMRLFMSIEEQHGVALPLSTLVSAPTVRLLSSVVTKQVPTSPSQLTVTKPERDWEWSIGILWSEILGNRDVQPTDNFFNLGGTDTDALQMLEQLKLLYGTIASLAELKKAPTVLRFAALTDGRAARSSLIPFNTQGTKTPLFCVAGPGGLALTFLPLARSLGPDQPLYGLQSHGVDRREIPDFTLGMTAWRYVRAIQKVQPQGPYLIGGHSFGGVLALKVVERLNAIGESVALLAIFDTIIYPRLSGLTADPSSAAASSPRKWWKFFKLPAKPSQMMRLPLAGLVRQQGVAQYELFALHSLVQARFARPLKPWGGRAAVFVSKGEQAKLVEATWNHLLTGPHSFIHVSGDHVSLLQRPHVTHLAPELAHEMADALAVESASQRTDTQPEINEG